MWFLVDHSPVFTVTVAGILEPATGNLHVWFWWSYMEAVDRDMCDKFVMHESPRKILGGEAGRGWS